MIRSIWRNNRDQSARPHFPGVGGEHHRPPRIYQRRARHHDDLPGSSRVQEPQCSTLSRPDCPSTSTYPRGRLSARLTRHRSLLRFSVLLNKAQQLRYAQPSSFRARLSRCRGQPGSGRSRPAPESTGRSVREDQPGACQTPGQTPFGGFVDRELFARYFPRMHRGPMLSPPHRPFRNMSIIMRPIFWRSRTGLAFIIFTFSFTHPATPNP